MTLLFERLRLQAHLTGLRERMGPVAGDQVIVAALEHVWATSLQKPEPDPKQAVESQWPVPKHQIDDAI